MATLEMLLEWELRLAKKEAENAKYWADRGIELDRREMELADREIELDRRHHELFMREMELDRREAEIDKRAFALNCYKPMGMA